VEERSTFVAMLDSLGAYHSFGAVTRGCWRRHLASDCAFPMRLVLECDEAWMGNWAVPMRKDLTGH